ncbi:hypothetical protein [Natroniella sp. ANB-PHB2]|uniref:hypothetical protein n=1 Tax=Natroniella sp. ANB-PHB2 TaxID=3384444 RepID=UPI0038D456A1
METEVSTLSAFINWVGVCAGAGIIGNIAFYSVEGLKNSFVNKFNKYFNSSKEAEEYLEDISNKSAINVNKPYRDIEDIYENTTEKKLPQEFVNELKSWVKENEEDIKKLVNQSQESNILNIKEQKAERDINNVQGVQIVNNSKE